MARERAGLGGFALECAAGFSLDERHATLKSFDIQAQGNQLQLRAFLFRDGVVYKGDEIVAAGGDALLATLDLGEKRAVGKGASGSVYYVENKFDG